MFTVELPYEIGTFVRVKTDFTKRPVGSVVAYTVHENGYFIWVSYHKQSGAEECDPENVEPLSEDVITAIDNGYWMPGIDGSYMCPWCRKVHRDIGDECEFCGAKLTLTEEWF